MARPKRSSIILHRAEKREAGLISIHPTLDLGNGLTLEAYTRLIEYLRTQISNYNTVIANLDDLSRQIKGTEQQLRDLTEQMLLGVAAKYGKSSREYGKAGGIPKYERRRSLRKQPEEESDAFSLPSGLPTLSLEVDPASTNGSVGSRV